MTSYWYLFIGGGVGIVVGFKQVEGQRPTGRKQWDTLRLKIPFKIGDIVQKVALARWSRTLSALTTAGVPLMQALEITGKTVGQLAGREGDERRHRVGPPRRHDRGAAQGVAGLPGHGHAHDRRGRGDRRPRHDARQGRRLLRGPGRRGRQGADLDPRAGDDRRRRRRSSASSSSRMYMPLFKVYDQIQ